MRKWLLLVAVGALGSGVGCHGRLFHRPCPPDRTGVTDRPRLGDPIPGSRIPSPDVPTDSTPAPILPERRGSIDPRGADGWRRVPADELPGSRLPPQDLALPSDERAYQQPNGVAPRRLLGEPVPPAGLNLPSAPPATAPSEGELPPRPNRSALSPTKPTTPAPPAASPESAKDSPKVMPSFAPIPGRDGVTSGRKLTPETLDALKQNGVRTVLFLHAPGDDLTAAKEQTERRGLRFTPLAVSPANLREALTNFTRAVTDPATKPVHVADESGARGGTLWYLLFRTAEQRNDEIARLRATPLGLPDPATADGQRYWPAIQDVLTK